MPDYELTQKRLLNLREYTQLAPPPDALETVNRYVLITSDEHHQVDWSFATEADLLLSCMLEVSQQPCRIVGAYDLDAQGESAKLSMLASSHVIETPEQPLLERSEMKEAALEILEATPGFTEAAKHIRIYKRVGPGPLGAQIARVAGYNGDVGASRFITLWKDENQTGQYDALPTSEDVRRGALSSFHQPRSYVKSFDLLTKLPFTVSVEAHLEGKYPMFVLPYML